MIKNIREKVFDYNITYIAIYINQRDCQRGLLESNYSSPRESRMIGPSPSRTYERVEQRQLQIKGRERSWRAKREENLYLSSRLEKKPFLDFLPRDPPCVPFPLSGKRESYETVRPLCRICFSLPRLLGRILTNKITRRHELLSLSLSFLPSFSLRSDNAQRSPTPPMIHPPFRRLDYAESLVPWSLFRVVLALLLDPPIKSPSPSPPSAARVHRIANTYTLSAPDRSLRRVKCAIDERSAKGVDVNNTHFIRATRYDTLEDGARSGRPPRSQGSLSGWGKGTLSL